ncbi:putative porin [Shewanella sp. FJAT-51649]|uniref:putative porin n=1 Tax=Shewanella sp. FJAT-51649 TaxID=2864210 RepID=UPI001C65F36A|nr:putative porin [Shewanella sp. FJAT-51649]QYJ71244.1 putative porin [Shewanella sp. FJAT-51649]
MLINRLNLALLLALTSTTTLAVTDNTYQHDVNLVYASSTDEFSDGSWDADYRYYFTPVSQDTVPYALSGFLAQSSNIRVGYNVSDHSDFYLIDGEYVFDSKWFIGLSYGVVDSDYQDTNNYGAKLGYYFNDNSAVYLKYSTDNTDLAYGTYYKGEIDVDSVGLGIRSFIPLESTAGVDLYADLSYSHRESSSTYNIDTQYRYTSNDTSLNLGARWFINKSWAVGASHTIQDEDDPSTIYTSYYWRITDFISAQTSISKFIDSDADDVFLALGINGRF